MQFDTPTTLEEMYDTLNEIYNYYRLQPENYTAADLQPLQLTRMTFTPLTDAELLVKAQANIDAAQKLRLMNYIDALNEKANEYERKAQAEIAAETAEKADNDKTFDAAKEEIVKRAVKSGITDSGIYAEKLAALEKERGKKASAITAARVAAATVYTAKKNACLALIESAPTKFSDVCASELTAEFNKLKDEQNKTVRQVFEYNNALDEKEQRYENTRKQNVASMLLRHMEIRAEGISKDELVQRGYYNDVVDCIKGYFDSLTASAAYESIKNQARLIVYLDDFYSNMIFYYKVNAE